MRTREEALAYALSFPDTYQDAPFRDDNWQLVRVKGSLPERSYLAAPMYRQTGWKQMEFRSWIIG